MIALCVGILFLAFAVFSVLPLGIGLGWWPLVVQFLQGAAPVIAAFVGLIAVFIGIADIKDRAESRKETAAEPKAN